MITDKNTYAVLLAGGKGTRLWPLSTEFCSKSFVRIGKRKSLISEAIDRLRGVIDRKNIIIVVDKTQETLLKNSAKRIPVRNILVEPFGRSTASAVGLAAIKLKADDVMVVLPTDSLIRGKKGFTKAIKNAVGFARREKNVLLSIGVKPKEASTAYGYIKIGPRAAGNIYPVDKFMEKPSKKVAEHLVKSASYLWNSGIFVFRAGDILAAVKKHAPILHRELERIRKNKKNIKNAYSRMKNVSIDYQIMEKAKNLHCAKGDFYWHDLGNWRSLEKLLKKDRRGNASFGKITMVDIRDSIVYNSASGKLGVTGLRGMVVARTENGMLVCPKKDAERVKELATKLNIKR